MGPESFKNAYVGCCLSLNSSISHIFDRIIHKQEVNFFVRQCWKSKRLTAKMQVTFTSTYTNGKRTLILPLRILQITVCITCRLQLELEPKPKKLLENVVLKFKNIKVSKIKSDESKERLFGMRCFYFF